MHQLSEVHLTASDVTNPKELVFNVISKIAVAVIMWDAQLRGNSSIHGIRCTKDSDNQPTTLLFQCFATNIWTKEQRYLNNSEKQASPPSKNVYLTGKYSP